MHNMTHLKSIAITILFLLTSACGVQETSNSTSSTDGSCKVSADCEGNLVCHETGICSVAAREQVTKDVSFIFSPTSESGQLPQRSPVISASPDTSIQFVLDSSVPVFGEVTNASGQRIQEGTLIFTPQYDLNGVLRQQTELNDEAFELAGQDANFSIDLLPGTYNITFISGNASIPNRRWSNQEIGSSATSLALVLPPNSAITTIEGTITHQDPTLNLEPGLNRIPVTHARVQATAADGSTSTADVTDEQGNFSIRVWKDNGDHDLRIGPATPNAPVPRYTQYNAFNPESGQAQALAVDLGSWSTQRLELRVQLLEQMLGSQYSGLDFSPSDARLILTGTLPDGNTITFYTTPNNQEALTLIPLNYVVSLVPPPTSKFGILTFEWNPLESDSLWTGQGVSLPLRKELGAQVTDAFGNPIPNARIEISPVQEPTSKQDSPSTQQAIETETRDLTLETDSEGYFSAWLEPDWSYKIDVTPTAQTNAPIGSFTINALTSDTSEFIFALPKPVVISGIVNGLQSDETLQPVQDTAFQVFDESTNPPQPIGQGRTNASGYFRVILPAE